MEAATERAATHAIAKVFKNFLYPLMSTLFRRRQRHLPDSAAIAVAMESPSRQLAPKLPEVLLSMFLLDGEAYDQLDQHRGVEQAPRSRWASADRVGELDVGTFVINRLTPLRRLATRVSPRCA